MNKYGAVFAADWQDEFTYRLNFILWRLRNVLRLLMTYFLWNGVFATNQVIFGYDKTQIVTYIFLVLTIQSLILSAPSADNIGSEIGDGDLSNYLVKPIHYIWYWFSRDLASKLLNLIFSVGEISLLWLLLRPQLNLHFSYLGVAGIILLLISAIFIYFFLNLSTRFVSFWAPDSTWGISFVVLVFLETLAGSIFPLDILPHWATVALQFTPFPYLIYYPIAVLQGKIFGSEILRIVGQSLIWTILLGLLAKVIWKNGLKVYGAEGR